MKRSLFVVALLAAGGSQAAGFSVTAHSARATGMGIATVAHLDDASAIAYNPATLSLLRGFEVQLGDTLIAPNIRFTPAGTEAAQDSDFTVAPPPHVFIAMPLMKDLVAGVGVYTPFGSSLKWPEDFSGRFLAQRSQLATFDVTPTVAYAPMEWLRVGAGLQLMYGTVDLQRRLPIPLPSGLTEGGIQLKGSDTGVGFTAGLQVALVQDFLSLGVAYRSKVDLDFEGTAEFSDIPEPLQAMFTPQDVTASVSLPATLTLGLAVKPTRKLTLAFDATWWEWSRLKELVVDFANPALEDTRLPKRWHVVWSFGLGGEYKLSDALAVQAGLGYERTPVPDETLTPDLPDADRWRAHLGAGYAFGSFNVGLGYEFLLLPDKTSTAQVLPGTYNGTAHVLVVTLGYRAGGWGGMQ
jgi:long-chain fatty acid transport protein